mmetsp:Transcript_55948/g.155815  ORF Transcript_55948/g.155815 Transcript_55948/m.155815 type:complete len:461 (+) Transcript_55948:163-1545(+)
MQKTGGGTAPSNKKQAGRTREARPLRPNESRQGHLGLAQDRDRPASGCGTILAAAPFDDPRDQDLAVVAGPTCHVRGRLHAGVAASLHGRPHHARGPQHGHARVPRRQPRAQAGFQPAAAAHLHALHGVDLACLLRGSAGRAAGPHDEVCCKVPMQAAVADAQVLPPGRKRQCLQRAARQQSYQQGRLVPQLRAVVELAVPQHACEAGDDPAAEPGETRAPEAHDPRRGVGVRDTHRGAAQRVAQDAHVRARRAEIGAEVAGGPDHGRGREVHGDGVLRRVRRPRVRHARLVRTGEDDHARNADEGPYDAEGGAPEGHLLVAQHVLVGPLGGPGRRQRDSSCAAGAAATLSSFFASATWASRFFFFLEILPAMVLWLSWASSSARTGLATIVTARPRVAAKTARLARGLDASRICSSAADGRCSSTAPRNDRGLAPPRAPGATKPTAALAQPASATQSAR